MENTTINEEIDVATPEAQAERIGGGVNPYTSLLLQTEPGQRRFLVSNFANGPHPIVLRSIDYLRHLHDLALAYGAGAERQSIILQANDTPDDQRSIAFQALRNWASVCVIPDPYYFLAGGVTEFCSVDIPWEQRRDVIFWRGSTTGIPNLAIEQLDFLPRYRLARLGALLGTAADIGFTAVVQALDQRNQTAIADRLTHEGLMRDYVQPANFNEVRYLIDIDGNASAWNCMQRLRAGACVLKVDSPWYQWFGDRLNAWEHYVPIAADLSDIEEKLGWCRSNALTSRQIACRGRRFAFDMAFDKEMEAASKLVFA